MKSRRHVLARWAALPVLALLLVGVLRPAPAADYVIQPEDVLAVKVAGEPGLSQNYPVNAKGEIVMDMAGAIGLKGKTIKQAEEAVKMALSKFIKENLLQVSIFVVPDAGAGGGGGKVLVFGEVQKPGSIKVKPDTRFLDAIADAGQPTDKADTRKISLVRKGEKPMILDLDAVLKDPDLNIVLMAGDTITVPSKTASSVTVTGEVQNPGPKSLENARTLLEAVKAANPTPKADWSRISVRSRGNQEPEVVDLRKARNAPEEDTHSLKEGDTIFVPSKELGVASISGQVQNPGEKDLSGSINVFDFITKHAGGFTEKADRYHVRIIRSGQPIRTVNVAAVEEGLKSPDDAEFQVAAGDRVVVPSGEVSLFGAVKEQGAKNVGATSNVLDFILSQGGGFTEYADRSKISIKSPGGKTRTVDLTDYASGLKNPDENPELLIQSGDVIRVPRDERNRFVIVGGVNKPGNYPLQPGMTLFDAISEAQSFSPFAAKKFVVARASAFDSEGRMRPLEPGAKTTTESGNTGASEAAKEPKDDKKRDSKKKRDKEDEDDEKKLPTDMILVDWKKFEKGDHTQNVRLMPGDRILIPEERPSNKQTLFDKITRLGGIAAGALFY